jgi:vancomycin resistance protein YoaR
MRRVARRRVTKAGHPAPKHRAPRRRPPRADHRRLRLALVSLVALAVLGGAVATLARPYGGLPDGTVIAGVDVSGRSTADAREALEARAGELLAGTLQVRAGSTSQELDLSALGLVPRIDDALAAARDRSTAFGRVRQRLGMGEPREVPLRFTVDRKLLDKALRPLARKVEEPVAPARVRLRDNGAFAIQPGKGGIRMERKVLVTTLQNLPSAGLAVEVPVRRVQPDATMQSARQAIADARKLLETEHVIVLGGTREPIPRETLAGAVAFVADKGRVRLRLARPPLEAFLGTVFAAAEKEAQNARFAVAEDGSVHIVPEQDGRVADAAAVGRALEQEPGRTEVPVQVVSQPATFTAEDAKGLGITDLVGEFTTAYWPGEPRVTNIQRAAETIDGTILQPGEAFDLNQRLGERTIERGYVVAPMIDEGRLRDAVGGGVSQIATTVFNAAYLGGYEILAHMPHEFWIPRYPKGQEATVSWGGPELIFRNDWSAPLVILAEASVDRVSVRIFSQDLERRVESGIDEPRDLVPAKTREVLNSELGVGVEETIQNGGQEGFTVDYWRKVWRGDTLVRDERYSHEYRPEDTIIEHGPKPKPKPKPKPDPDATSGPTDSTGGTQPATGEAPASSGEGPPPPEPSPSAGQAPPATGAPTATG